VCEWGGAMCGARGTVPLSNRGLLFLDVSIAMDCISIIDILSVFGETTRGRHAYEI